MVQKCLILATIVMLMVIFNGNNVDCLNDYVDGQRDDDYYGALKDSDDLPIPMQKFFLRRRSISDDNHQAKNLSFIVKDVEMKEENATQECPFLEQTNNEFQQNKVNVQASKKSYSQTEASEQQTSVGNAQPSHENATKSLDSRQPETVYEEQKTRQLQKLIQQLYVSQAQVQLEAIEIQRAQSVAAQAQQSLEEAANNVRVISQTLKAAQETVAAAALRAQTAQMQLAAHDQLLFAARQKVDALSAQMVGLQAEEGIVPRTPSVNLQELLKKLNEPLPDTEKPKPIASILYAENPATVSNEKNTRFNERLIRNGDSPQLPKSKSQTERLSEQDISEFVDILLALRKLNPKTVSTTADTNSPTISTKTNSKDENEKLFNSFLKKMQNTHLTPSITPSSKKLRDAKMNDYILNLYESIRKPSPAIISPEQTFAMENLKLADDKSKSVDVSSKPSEEFEENIMRNNVAAAINDDEYISAPDHNDKLIYDYIHA